MSKVVTPDPRSKHQSGKDRKQQPFKPKQPLVNQTLEEKLVVLHYGTNNNFIKWRETMFAFLTTKYGPLACIVKTGLIHEDPMPMPNLPIAAPSLPAADSTQKN